MTSLPDIRHALATDYPAIIEMMDALAKEEHGLSSLDEEALSQQMHDGEPALTALVGLDDNMPVSCLLAYPGYDVLSATCGWHLSDVYVRHDHRHQGYGRAMLATLSRDGLMRGMEWMSWTVLKGNRKAKQFYHEIGATDVGVQFMALGVTRMRHLAEKY